MIHYRGNPWQSNVQELILEVSVMSLTWYISRGLCTFELLLPECDYDLYEMSQVDRLICSGCEKSTWNLVKRISNSVSHLYEADYVSCCKKKFKIFGKRNSYSVSQIFPIFFKSGLCNPFQNGVKRMPECVS